MDLHRFSLIIFVAFSAVGCANISGSALDNVRFQVANANAAEIISRQRNSVLQNQSLTSRVFYVPDQSIVPAAIVSTLQDLGYFINDSNRTGYVSGIRTLHTDDRVTVTFRSEDDDFVTVRANFSISLIDPNGAVQYQRFFSSLNKSIFLKINGL